MERSRDAELELRRGPSPPRAARSPEADGDKAASHSCCICGKSFPFQSSLSQHMRKHTGQKPYQCPYCGHRASQKGSLKVHIRSHRTGTLAQGHEPEAGEARVSEGLDGCTSPTKSTSACNRILNGAAQGGSGKILLRSSRKEAEAPAGAALAQCSFCRSRFQRRADLERHVHQAHKTFRCRLCSYVTLREEALLSHIGKDHVTAQVPRGEAYAEGGKPELPPGEFPCEVCGQAFSQTWFLKAHMKKHRGSFDHGCHICGRRFKEPWFLKNHMKAHGPKAGGKNRPRSELDPVATINDVVQEEAIVAGLALYEVCTKCGNLFTNLDSLNAHNAVHRRGEAGRTRALAGEDGAPGPADSQQLFLQCLDLRPAGAGAPALGQAGQRVAELDPVNSYQAWQLATRGKVAEPAEYLKYGAWDEALAGDVAFDRERREYILVSQEKRKRELEPGMQGPPRKRAGAPGDPTPGPAAPRPAARPGRRTAAPAGQGKSSECFECGKIFRTYHQMVLHSRVHRRARRHRDGPGDRAPRARCGSLSEGDSASQPSSPSSACATADSPGSRLAEDAAGDSGEEGAADHAPGGKPRRCCCSEGVASPVLCNGDQSHGRGGGPSENGTGAPSGAAAACVCLLDDGRGGRPRTPEQPGLPVDSKTPAARSRRDASGPRGTAASPPRSEQSFREGAGLRLSPRKEEPGDAHSRGRPAAADLTPLDLSHLSTRGDPGHKDLAASLQASLAVHLCPYCSHKTYYPEVLWMHQRVWHRISCTSVAPQWVQPNGHRSIRNNLVFLVRSGRTGPPPALGGRECQPLPIARFTRTQGPAGAPGPSGSCSPTAGVARATGTPRSREGHPGGPCALWTASPEGPRQTKPGHGPEQHGSLAQLPPHRPKQEAGPRPGSAGGGFSRSATPTPTVIARAGSQPPAPGRLGDKYVVPPAGAGGGPPSKHSVPEPLKAKFSPQPLGQLHAKGDGLALPASTAGPGCRGDTALQTPPTPQAARQEPPGGHEKHVDILSIFKTCIPRDFTTLYQSWGASGSAREHRGERPC
ncbi:zinc finger protein 516 isoform X3 [Pteropus medius]|uniref:zinc finger protein 516 isoform X3 n=1 Tax=Pteropus vampyrus TaxID=132908 RepID=UPI00196B8646|nr:zinc finger protein 516 isoform X3 [Pteropus giganteus]